MVNVPMKDDLKEYCELAEKTAKEQKEYFTGPSRERCISMLTDAMD